MTEQALDGEILHTMELPLIQSRETPPMLCIYYTYHLDQKKSSWKNRSEHAVCFRAVSIKHGAREFYLDRLLWSLGFCINVNTIERILKDYHTEKTTQQP